MTRRVSWIALVTLLFFGLAAAAGEKTPCTAPAGECVKKMYEKFQSAGWLGIEGEKSEKSLVAIKAVIPGSPAAAAGFQAGDVLLAINGVELSEANKEAQMKVKQSLVAGSEATYVVRRQGAKKTLTAKLVAPPRAVVAQWIGEHMLTHHLSSQVASK
jgi:predicted metalloprotease with PDZ domain